MIRTPFPGGSYCDAVPGAWAVLFQGSHIQTHLGRLDLPRPDSWPLYLRITLTPEFQIAGQVTGGTQPGTWHYRRSSGWTLVPVIAAGQSGCIFDRDGKLHILAGGPHVTSQGYRYVADDGRLVLGDATYGSDFGLSEWSEIADLKIGQGNPGGGVRVWDDTRLRELEPGHCTFIRASRWGDQVAIATIKQGEGAILFAGTLNDLRALPVVTPEPTPDPEPNPDPTPEPEPMPPDYRPIPSFFEVVQAVWTRATDVQRRTHGWISNAVAWELDQRRADGRRWFRNLKRGGPDISEDALSTPHNLGAGGWAIIDVVGNFGRGDAGPAWTDVTQATIDLGEIGGGVAPTDPWGGAAPEPEPGPTDPDVATLRARIAVLEAELKDCHDELADWRGHVQAQDDYQLLLGTIAAAGAAYGRERGVIVLPNNVNELQAMIVALMAERPLGDELTAHLCSRFILRRDTDEMIVEEARKRGNGSWRDDW